VALKFKGKRLMGLSRTRRFSQEIEKGRLGRKRRLSMDPYKTDRNTRRMNLA
jgi:hypothetical protein